MLINRWKGISKNTTRYQNCNVTLKLVVIKDYESAFDALTLIQIPQWLTCPTFSLCLLLKSKRFHQQPGFYRRYSNCLNWKKTFQLLKLENLLRWSFFTLIYNRSSNIWIISCILHIRRYSVTKSMPFWLKRTRYKLR